MLVMEPVMEHTFTTISPLPEKAAKVKRYKSVGTFLQQGIRIWN